MSNIKEKERISKASGKWLMISPHKARLVADMIRYKKVPQALEQLEFSDKKAAGMIRKILLSAVSNAEAHHAEDPEESIVAIQVGPAGNLKRMQPRAFGRATVRLKRRSHIWIELYK